jgi:alkylation response protein AidB-like acyl-CoA dehydrogenase
MAVTNMVGEVVARFGTPDQRQLVVPALAAGALGAFALSEVGAGSDPGAMRTTARREGDEWVIQGTKQWISHGDTSRFIVLWARTGDPGTKGISCFLLDGDTDGLSVSSHEDKMGLRASHTVGLLLEDVRVPADRLLGEIGEGFSIAMMALDGGRIGIASQALGIATRALDCARAHLRSIPTLHDEQGRLWKLADSVTDLEAARWLVLRAASMKEAGVSFSKEASMAKVYATEAAWRVVNRSVDLTADAEDELRIITERCLRDARVTRIYEGTSEVQRIVISRAALG